MPTPGRPTKLTPELAARIVKSVQQGNYIETAAALHGVGKATVFRWLKEAEAGKKAQREFRDALIKAEAKAEADQLASIAKAGKDGAWQANAWRLERKNPKKWGMRVRVHVNDELNAVLDRIEKEFAKEPELLERVLSCISRTDEDSHGEAATTED